MEAKFKKAEAREATAVERHSHNRKSSRGMIEAHHVEAVAERAGVSIDTINPNSS